MTKLTLWILALWLPSLAMAGDSTDIYRASGIQAKLLTNAHSVVRYKSMEIDINGPDKAQIKTREVITILDAEAEYELYMFHYSNRFTVLDDAEIKLYDANGKLLEKHKKKDFSSYSDGSGLVEDGQTYVIKVTAGSYPVTVEKESVYRLKSIYVLDNFFFSRPYQSVEFARVSLKYPTSLPVKFKSYHLDAKPTLTKNGSDEIWLWQARNLAAEFHEASAGDWRFQVPSVFFSMTKFSYDGYAGDMSSWRNICLWYNYIVGKNNKLSPENQEEIKRLVAGAKTDREKVEMLYTYLQKNFRYVSIQLGIGGFRPFPADFVHSKKYGDCKGLSNYMEACLDALGIKSNVAIINGGSTKLDLDTDFPFPNFNHMILMVPLDKDSIWLECTSSYNDFGHLSTFTENRYALLVTPSGGQLVRTPSSIGTQNKLSINARVKLSADGEAETTSSLKADREFKYNMVGISMLSGDKQKEAFLSEYSITQPDEFNIGFNPSSDSGYIVTNELFWEKGYEFKAGAKIFLKPRIYKIWTEKLPADSSRKFDYYLDFPCSKSDTTEYQLPEGFTVESLPKGRSISSSVGLFTSKYWFDDKVKKVFSTAILEIKLFRVPAAKYQEAKQFFDQVLDDGNQKIIVLNNNALTKL